MSEYRQDVTTGAWVIVAPERGRRPRFGPPGGVIPAAPLPPHDPQCPFCPGNEHLLSAIVEEIPGAVPPGWVVRVVPNKFPAVSPAVDAAAPAEQAGPARAGYGFHEVIVESSRHDGNLATLSEADLRAVARAYRDRYIVLSGRPGVAATLLFRNHRRKAGASLAHPHSQIIAISVMPPRLTSAADWMRAQLEQHGRCVTCEMLEAEQLAQEERIVEETESFVVLVPFAASSPFEMWLLPRRHQASFGDMDENDLNEFADLLQSALQRLGTVLEDPPYNFVVESWDGRDVDFVHWRLRIVPDVVTPGGFELGAGVPINPSRPEDDAEALRSATSVS